MLKKCINCGKEFIDNTKGKCKQSCSHECARQVINRREKIRRKANIVKKILNNQEPYKKQDKECLNCGVIYKGFPHSKYCSVFCRTQYTELRRSIALLERRDFNMLLDPEFDQVWV